MCIHDISFFLSYIHGIWNIERVGPDAENKEDSDHAPGEVQRIPILFEINIGSLLQNIAHFLAIVNKYTILQSGVSFQANNCYSPVEHVDINWAPLPVLLLSPDLRPASGRWVQQRALKRGTSGLARRCIMRI